MNENRIIELIKSGNKIKYIARNYAIPESQINAVKKKYNLDREYGPRQQDKSKRAMLNGKLVYKSKYPFHFQQCKKESFGSRKGDSFSDAF